MRITCPKCSWSYEMVTKEKVNRTNRQNRAYFGLAVEKLAQQSNCSKDAMHKALAGEFIGYNEVEISGRKVKVPKSTTELNTLEFSNFFERIQRYAAENGLDIPNPNEVLE